MVRVGKDFGVPIGIATVGLTLLLIWQVTPFRHFTERMPQKVESSEPMRPKEPLQGHLSSGPGVASSLKGSWSRFRGDAYNNRAVTPPEEVDIHNISPNSPRAIWSVDVGEGYAGAAIRGGKVYLLDYDRTAQADVLRCMSLDDGRDIWRFSYPVKIKRNHGMSRTVCAVTDNVVIGFGPKCHVVCLDAQSGEQKWLMDLVAQYGAEVPLWYAGQCPLIDADRVILAIGGPDTLLTAVDYESGEIVWTTPNPHHWKMTHSSVMPMEFQGTRMYVYCAGGGVVGVSAEDGHVLWETDEWTIRIATVPSPLIIPPDRIFLSGGYNAGSMMLRIIQSPEGQPDVETLYHLKPDVFGSTQHTPIYYDGHIYGVRPDEQLVCLNLDGKILWNSGSEARFGIGPYVLINDHLFVMDDEGQLTVVRATPQSFQILGQARVLSGHESWGPMAYAGGRLIVRDLTILVCLDLH